MYNTKKRKPTKTSIKRNEAYIGERIELKIDRIMNNKEPIEGTSPLIYTERKDGVRAETNIRTDKWDVALDAMNTSVRSNRAKREQARIVQMEKDKKKAEPSQ